MIYLILQMLVALSLATLLGGALGWIVHRAAHNNRVHELHQGLRRQQSQLNQAQSEIAMLSDDYDEMHSRSQEELEALREDNQKIPFLNTNLEKSQLLVRQMMQKHEAKIRDLTGENQKLTVRLKSTEDREQAHNKIQAELDSRRREKNRLMDDQPETSSPVEQVLNSSTSSLNNTSEDSLQHQTDAASSEAHTDTSADTRTDTSDETVPVAVPLDSVQISNAKPTSSWASAALSLSSTIQDDQNHSIDIDADADPFDNVMEVGDELQRELSCAAAQGATLESAAPESAELDNPNEHSTTLESAALAGTEHGSSQPVTAPPDSNAANTEQLDFELSDSDNNLHKHGLLDGSTDDSNLFNPVEQQDDLQQIFGIGPVTEKALNDMGITSYSQLAELKHHEVQSIADALQIVPGRIERDDWMGNARRQLEDVLEQL